MQFIDCPIATYCIGLAASGAAVLLAGGTKGRRFALPHSKIMIHQPYGQVGGQVSDIEIQAEEILKSRQVINEILAKHTGQPIERIAKDTERDRYLTAHPGQGVRPGRRGRRPDPHRRGRRARPRLARDPDPPGGRTISRARPGIASRHRPTTGHRPADPSPEPEGTPPCHWSRS